jgi:hypothetical protein
MVGEIFKVKGNEYIPTSNALGIPEFRMLWDNVDNPEIYFCFLHYYYYPTSAYSEVPESDRWEVVKKDFPVDDEDPFFIAAKNKCEILYTTPLKRGFLATKRGYDNLSLAVENQTSISFGRDGNATDIASYIKNSESYMTAYAAAEKKYKEEISAYGSRDLGFDDNMDYDTLDIELN